MASSQRWRMGGTGLVGVLLVAFILGAHGAAQAGLTCGPPDNAAPGVVSNALGTADTNSGCEVGSQSNDAPPPPPGVVNADNMFGINSWQFRGKLAADPDDEDLGEIDGNSGTINLATWLDVFNSVNRVMLVFKGPNGGPFASDFYIGYLFTAANFDGDPPGFLVSWTTPFGGDDTTSHISIYFTEVSAVPLPAALPLMLAALAGLAGLVGWRRRRRRRAQPEFAPA